MSAIAEYVHVVSCNCESLARGCAYPVETDTELYNQLVPCPLAFSKQVY